MPVAVCVGGNFLPVPKKGYWLDYTADDEQYAGDLYKCPTEERCGKVDDVGYVMAFTARDRAEHYAQVQGVVVG